MSAAHQGEDRLDTCGQRLAAPGQLRQPLPAAREHLLDLRLLRGGGAFGATVEQSALDERRGQTAMAAVGRRDDRVLASCRQRNGHPQR
jgi:hypothetical protein